MPALPLNGRTAVVTGANHGIGAAIAVELARLGSNVLLTFLRSPLRQPLRSITRPTISATQGTGLSVAAAAYDVERGRDATAVIELIESQGSRGFAIETDLTASEAPRRVFDEAERAFGPVSILVNNASGWRQDTFSGESQDLMSRPMEEVTEATFEANFGVDAKASALLIAEFSRRHRHSGGTWGRIVGVSSGGSSGFPSEVSYGAAKAALENYTMSAASELARFGVTANIVHPPITDTGWVTEEVRRFADEQGARVATPAEVAEVIGWLCTDAASLVTGNRIRLR